jgi:hypothetical protein
MSLSSLVATLGYYPIVASTAPISGSGVPVDFRKEEQIIKPLLIVKKVEYYEGSEVQNVNRTVIVKSVK